MNQKRACSRCGRRIEVGRAKIGRVVFPGGICYGCWCRDGGKKKPKKVKTEAHNG